VYIGYQSGYLNSSGQLNAIIGTQAAFTGTTADSTTAIGYQALYYNRQNKQVAVGFQSMYNNTSGTDNIALGYRALYSNQTHGSNTAIGFQALYAATANYNTAVGPHSLEGLTTGTNVTAVGYAAGGGNTTGSSNTYLGDSTGSINSTGSNNTYIGRGANANANNYSSSTAIGTGAIITGSNQVVLGRASEKVVMPGDASLNGNIVIGRNLTVLGNIAVQNYTNQSIINTTTTNYQLIVSEDISLNGRLCVSSDTSLNANLFIGRDLSLNGNLYVKSINVKDISGVNNFFGNLQYTYNTPNTATFDANGFAILKNIDSSATVIYSTIDMSINGNLFVGNDLSYAGNLYVKPNSIDPMAIRYGISNQFGTFQYNYTTPNTALYDDDGFGILRYIDSSSQVLYSKTDLSLSGMLNVSTDTSLNGNVYIGKDISLNGNIVIGKNLTVLGNIAVKNYTNQSIINTTTTNYQLIVSEDISLNGRLFVRDNVGIGTAAPSTALHVVGTTTSTAFNALSDYRLKDNITNLDQTYNIDNLRPVKYTFKTNNSQQIGFIAHEIQEHYPMLVDGEKDGQTHQSINMNGIIPLLVNDLKRSKERIDELETRMKHLEAQLSRMI
jgi:hypothetical protein